MKVAIFDFDGTLFESAVYWVKVINQYLVERDIETEDDILSIAKPLGISETAKMIREKFSLAETQNEIVTSWRSQMGKNYHDVIALREYAHEYIEKLHSKGISICLATAMERDFVIPALERTKIMPLFDLIVTISDVKANKNSPLIFQHCAEYFHVAPSECTVFEDSPQAAKICSDAGFHVIGVFDGVCVNDRELMSPFCDRFIDSFKELLDEGGDYLS